MRYPLHYSLILAAAWAGLVPAASGAAVPKINTDSGFDVPAAAIAKAAPSASAFPNAGAITLRDETTDVLHADGSHAEHVHQTIKIFNQRGRDSADVTIPYNEATQTVTGLHARTLKPDGSILPVKPEEVHVSSPYAGDAMYDDAKYVRFSLPGVEDGAIVDYAYTVTTRKATLPGQYADRWTFQGDSDPVRMSRFTLVAPASLALQTQMHNTPALTPVVRTSADGKTKTYVWQMQNLADLTSEPMMPPGDTYLPWMEVTTLPSWQSVAGWYQKLAAPRMAATPEIAALVKQLTAGKTTDTDKARALFYWVESRTRYVALELGLSAYQPHAAGEVCRNRYGDCKDMATLLLTMLHQAGIQSAWPVLLDAGNKEPQHDHLASPGAFDHAIVRADIDGKPYWFDCTAELSAFGEIPQGDRGVDAFVIRNGVGAFETIPLGPPAVNGEVDDIQVNLQPDGSADCTTKVAMVGDNALSLRSGLRSVKPDQIPQVFQGIVRKMSANATLTKDSFSPPEDRDAPVQMEVSFHAPLFALVAGSLLILTNNGADTSVFAPDTRRYPLYQSANTQSVSDTRIVVPKGYHVLVQPADIHQKTALGQMDITYTLSGNVLTAHKVYQQQPTTVAPADYQKLKTQMEHLSAQAKEPIVLQKLSSTDHVTKS